MPLPTPFMAATFPIEEQSTWKLQRLERMVKELREERSTLLSSLAKTKAALTKKSLEGKVHPVYPA